MSRYSRRLANKAHRIQVRQNRQQKQAGVAEARHTATDYGVREVVRSELIARQDQPHEAIAAYLGVPLWIVNGERLALANHRGPPAHTPRVKRISAHCLVGDLDAVLLGPCDDLGLLQ